MSIIPNKSSDHEETDTKLVAFIGNASIQPGNTVMVRSPHGDIGILAFSTSSVWKYYSPYR